MRTKEFIKRVEELGFWVEELNNIINVCEDKAGFYLVTIDKNYQYILNNMGNRYKNLDDYKKRDLLKVCYEYATTPVEEREQEKKFYLRHRWMKGSSKITNYLNLIISTDDMLLSSEQQDESVKTQFTMEEIEEIKEKYKTDLSDFEIVEVEEWLTFGKKQLK